MYKYGPYLGFVAIVLIALAYFCCYIVPEGKQAVVLQFGEVKSSQTKAGLYFKFPWREARMLEKRILNWDGRPEQTPTREKKYVIVDTTSRWRIIDPEKFVERLVTVNEAQNRIKSWIDSATKEVISSQRLVETVRSTNNIVQQDTARLRQAKADSRKKTSRAPTGEEAEATRDTSIDKIEEIVDVEISSEIEPIEIGRDELTEKIEEKAKQQMGRYGLELIDIQFKRVALEASVEDEVYKRMITERKRIATKIRSVGKGEQAKIRGNTSKDLQEIESEAYRTVQEIKGSAEAKSIAIYAQAFQEDPDFYQLIRTLEAYRSGLRDDANLILSAESDFLKFLQEGPHRALER